MARTGSSLERLKSQNTEYIKEIIYKYAPISRSEIAEMLQLTPPTITTNVAALIQKGLVYECETAPGQEKLHGGHALGRRRILVDFVPDARYTLGVAQGYFGTLLCLVDLRGNVVLERQYEDDIDDYEQMMDAIAERVEAFLEETQVPREKIAGLGIGLPGFVDGHRGVLRYGAIKKWKDKPVAEDLRRRTGFSCRVENSARCCALGEELFSGKLRPETFAYFFISRGLACPLVIRSRLHAGEMAGAGEVGHMVVDPSGPVCPTCGNRGCLEGVSSELAICNRCAQAMQAGVPSLLGAVCADPLHPQIEEILQAQRSSDRLVCSIMEEAVTYLGIMLSNIINFINPSLVIVDGRIMQEEENRRLLLQAAHSHLFSIQVEEVEIEFVPYNQFRPARGAAALAVKKFILQKDR
ncbi:MAG: ROK family transcriptional regulator [Provencibacterium sp.]|jgi:predicted NBD/HSP70 family sugar kinase|nr:ROK family transcriptional regulator [Provencibacterium sp.]